MTERRTLRVMAIACGLTAANLYYNQPMLTAIAVSIGIPGHSLGLIPMATQLGVSAGLLFLVPLGDRMDRKRLILCMLPLLIAALCGSALAPSFTWLVAASLATGILSTIPQQLVPLAAQISSPSQQGRAVGIVMGGLLAGILLSRTVSGLVAEWTSWRYMYGLAALLMILEFVMLWLWLPSTKAAASLSYPKLMRSMGGMLLRYKQLRISSLVGALLFGSFSLFWTTLTLWLASPAFGLHSSAAGLFGLLGAAGALAAPLAGRMADRKGPSAVLAIAIVSVAASFLIFRFLGGSLWGIGIGVLVLDIGIQAALIANQTKVFALESGAGSRLNTVFMSCYFLGGAAGSAIGTAAWQSGGWGLVCWLGFAMACAAIGVHLYGQRHLAQNAN